MRNAVREGQAGSVLAVARAIAERSALQAREIDDAIALLESCIGSFEISAWPEMVWRFSGLSTDGGPLQFTLSTCDDRLRYVSEVAGPELPNYRRVDAMGDFITLFGGVRPAAHESDYWKVLQSDRALRWGAWLGVRHDGFEKSLKLYVEVPIGAQPGRSVTDPIVPTSRLMMIGYDCKNRTKEYYFRQPQMDGHELSRFLGCMSATPRRRAVLEAFTDLCELPARPALQWMNFGYSLAGAADDAGQDVVLFVRSSSIGDISRIRKHFLNHESRSGRNGSAYQYLLGGVPAEHLPDHEIVSLIGRGACEVEMRVGVSALALTQLCARR